MSPLETSRRLSLKNILFATDFSAASEHALPLAKSLAEHYGATLFVVHVYHPEPGYEVPMPADFTPGLTMAERQMNALLQIHRLDNVAHKTLLLRSSDALWAITDSIEENEIDLIVLGTHGREGIRKVVLGSVAEGIIRCSACPVLTVGPHVPPVPATSTFHHVLCATDFSPSSRHALTYALAFAHENGAELCLLHVIEEVTRDLAIESRQAEVMERIRERLKDMASASAGLQHEPKLLVEIGVAGDSILQTARREAADLIVVGARSSGAPHISSHSPWRTTHKVICEASCPVLTVCG